MPGRACQKDSLPAIPGGKGSPVCERPLLVTGGNRTGTTWVGRMLSVSRRVGYIREAFNSEEGLLKETGTLSHEYEHIPPESLVHGKYHADIQRVLTFTYTWKQVLGMGATCPNPFSSHLKTRLIHFFLMMRNRLEKRRPLLKDPIAIFAAEWLCETFDMDVVVLIRHPAAYVASVQRLGWHFDFANLARQRSFLEGYLPELAEEILHPPGNPVARAALLWKCFYTVVKRYRENHPAWIFLRHEDLLDDPVHRFESLYHRLSLSFGGRERETIRAYTSSQNPVSAPGGAVHYLKRDSRSLKKLWKQQLSRREIALVRHRVEDVSACFYPPEAW